jgi:hypothetical protein
MALPEKHEEAIRLRKKGMPYSVIRAKLGVSKSTLSLWLRDMPLSQKEINDLRAFSPQRIERFRQAMRDKKNARRVQVFQKVSKEIGSFSKRDVFIAGLFLYWGEGTKTADCTTSLTNTDPSILRFYVAWLESLGIKRVDLRIKLHLYADQDVGELTKFWSDTLMISMDNFTKPYVKESRLTNKTYKGMFSYGTCVVSYHDRDLHEYVMEGITFLRDSNRK